MNAECSKYPTTKDLILALYGRDNNLPYIGQDIPTDISPEISPQLLKKLKTNQLLEELDILGIEEPILRKNAARIIHLYLKRQMNLPDIPDITPAEKLRDLYDCRVCVNHIAQVYLREIMVGRFIPENHDETKGIRLFESNQNLDWKEFSFICRKLSELKSE